PSSWSAHDCSQRRAPCGCRWNGLHHRQYRRFFYERNSRADRKEQRVESKIPDPARQPSQNLEQLAATATPEKNSGTSCKRPQPQWPLDYWTTDWILFNALTFQRFNSSYARLHHR